MREGGTPGGGGGPSAGTAARYGVAATEAVRVTLPDGSVAVT